MIVKNILSSCRRTGSYIVLVMLLSVIANKSVLAQVVPDDTLSSERSIVVPNLSIRGVESDRIEGGAIRGANLFHSFSQFNIDPGRGAYFTNPTGITNILSRVTGTTRSDISGRLGVLGTANLFLINPNGIVFGVAASLDVQGSFLATTANAVRLGDTGLFSASQPASSNLLSVSPSAFWFNAVAAQPIVNRSRAESNIGQTNSADIAPGLQVQPGRTLALVGGDVQLEGGRLNAPGGRIELGSVTGIGQVNLIQNGDRIALDYGSIPQFGTISIANRSLVDAGGEGGGDIQIRAAKLDVTQSSSVRSNTLGDQNGGTVSIRTTETTLSQSALLGNLTEGTGAGANLTIDTDRLIIRDGAQIATVTSSTGKGGNIQISAAESVKVTGESSGGRFSSLTTQSRGTGDAGEIKIDTRHVFVQDGAGIAINTFNTGKGGRLQINAAESIEISGQSRNSQSSSNVIIQSRENATGNAGEIQLNTGRLLVRDGARIGTDTFGAGQGGSLQINAESVEVVGISADGRVSSSLRAVSEGAGDAGEIKINARRLLVQDGASLSTTTFSSGKGGSLQITAESVEVAGLSDNGRFISVLAAQSGVDATGDAGEIKIATGRLLVRDGAGISTATFGVGNGGSLQINATDSVEVRGRAPDGSLPSGLTTQSQRSGNAGNLTIETQRLRVQNGGVVATSTFGAGKGGTLRINATESVDVDGRFSSDGQSNSSLIAQGGGTGSAGNIEIQTGELRVQDSAIISSASFGSGRAGDITITARDRVQANNGTIETRASRSAGGAITINAGAIRLFDNSDIRSDVASGADNGGNIALSANSILAFNDSDILAFAQDGRGGSITLNTPAFFGENYRPEPRGTNPESLDRNNRVDINATGAISGIITLPDVSFIQNSLTDLPDTGINTDSILANSCIVRQNQPKGSFTITGTGGLPQRPGDAQVSRFSTVNIETQLSDRNFSTSGQTWQKGDPIVEPQGVYRLPSGKLVLSRNCP